MDQLNIQTQQPIQPEPKKRKVGIIIAIIFVITLLGVGGYLTYKQFNTTNNKEKENGTVNKEKQEEQEPQETIQENSDYIYHVFTAADNKTNIILAFKSEGFDYSYDLKNCSNTNLLIYYLETDLAVSGMEPIIVTDNSSAKKIDDHYYILTINENEHYIFYKTGEVTEENLWIGLLFIDNYNRSKLETELTEDINQYKENFKIFTYSENKDNFFTYLDENALKHVVDEKGNTTDISSYTDLQDLMIEKIEESGVSINKKEVLSVETIDNNYFMIRIYDEENIFDMFDFMEVNKEDISNDNQKFEINGYEAIVSLNENSSVGRKYDVYIHKDNKIYMSSQMGETKEEAINRSKKYFSK